MTVVDTQQAILTAIYNILTADTSLKASMGGTVRLSPVWAPPDSEFPYLVHRIDIRAVDGEFVNRAGTYFLDIWSYSPNASECLAIRKRIIELLDVREITATEITAGRLQLQTESFVPESTDQIWHYATQWGIRYSRASEIDGILSRT